jgi:hypothetical protein
MASSTKLLLLLFAIGCSEENRSKEEFKSSYNKRSQEECADSLWNYTNVGQPFMMTWCTSCHHSDLRTDLRPDGTDGVNFESHSLVISQIERIEARAISEPPTMPPAGGPSDAELQRLREWIECGAPE